MSVNNEANAIDLLLFLPQWNMCMLDKDPTKDHLTRSEKSMDISDTHRSKVNVAINRIGMMLDMTDFSSLCINCDTVVAAMISADGPQPLWRLILLKFISLLNNPDFDSWYNHTKGAMPLLHWHVYTFLERIYNHFAVFATSYKFQQRQCYWQRSPFGRAGYQTHSEGLDCAQRVSSSP